MSRDSRLPTREPAILASHGASRGCAWPFRRLKMASRPHRIFRSHFWDSDAFRLCRSAPKNFSKLEESNILPGQGPMRCYRLSFRCRRITGAGWQLRSDSPPIAKFLINTTPRAPGPASKRDGVRTKPHHDTTSRSGLGRAGNVPGCYDLTKRRRCRIRGYQHTL